MRRVPKSLLMLRELATFSLRSRPISSSSQKITFLFAAAIVRIPWSFSELDMVGHSARKFLSDAERHRVFHYLLENTVNGKLRRGAINDAAQKFGVNRKVIRTIRSRASEASNPEEVKSAIERRNKQDVCISEETFKNASTYLASADGL